jgi:hypothetical protein
LASGEVRYGQAELIAQSSASIIKKLSPIGPSGGSVEALKDGDSYQSVTVSSVLDMYLQYLETPCGTRESLITSIKMIATGGIFSQGADR